MYFMNRNKKLVAMLVGTLALTNTVMPVCAEPKQPTLEYGEDFEYHLNDTENVKKQGNINLLNPSVGLVSNSNNMNNNGFPYLIQPNDTLSSIAKANNTTVEKLMETTGLTNPNKIKAGDILVSPYITEEFVLSKGQDPKQNEKKRAKVVEVSKREITESDRNILRSLFNAEEYAKMYPDVAEACKGSLDLLTFEQKLFEHFINNGIWEGRQPSESFSVAAYASAYSDLRKSFGSHIVEYYKHYYNTTVNGNENRTITTVQKAQDEGIKVTDFSGNTVAVDEAGNIVTGEKADKIAAEKNLGDPFRAFIMPTPNVTVSADFNEETEKEEETQAPSSEDKKEPTKEDIDTNVSSEPEKPGTDTDEVPKQEETEAEEETEADKEEEKPTEEKPSEEIPSEDKPAEEKPSEEIPSEDKSAEEKPEEENPSEEKPEEEKPAEEQPGEEKPSEEEPVAPTKTFAEAYKEWLADKPVGGSANVMESWKKREPNLADYADGRAFLAKKEAWEKEMPDYDAYLATTAYASDYEAWQAKEPKLEYYTILIGNQTAGEKYDEDYATWQKLAPKPEDYIQYTSFEADYNAWLAAAPVPVEGKYETAEKAMEAYTKAHTEWEANKPKQSDYFDEEGYNQAVTEWTNKTPQKDDYHNYEGYVDAVAKYERENPKPARSDYFNEESYNSALTEHAAEEPKFEDYFDDTAYTLACTTYQYEQEAYVAQKTEYDAKKAEYDTYLTAKAEYDAAKSQWESEKATYDAEFAKIEAINKPKREKYEADLAKYNEYLAWEKATAKEYLDKDIITIYTDAQGCVYYQYEYEYEGLGSYEQSTDLEIIFQVAHTDIGIGKLYEGSNAQIPEEPTEPTYEELPEGVINPGDFTQEEPQVVEDPGEFTETPPEAPLESDYAYQGTDKKTATELYDNDYAAWEQKSPSEDDDEFYDIDGYNEALANWEASYPKETDYYNSTKYDSLDAAKAAYEKAVADHEAAKPSEQDYVKEKAGDATDKESALKAFEEATGSYVAENPAPTEEEYTSNVMTDEEKAQYEQAVVDYNAAEPSETDSKYVEEAKETEEYKDAVVEHEADKPDESTYVDDKYIDDASADRAYNEDHSNWEGEKPSEDSYIADTTYAEDLGVWEESEPDVGEYFGIEVAE